MDSRLSPVLVRLINNDYINLASKLAEALNDESKSWLRYAALMAKRPGDPVRVEFKEEASGVQNILETLSKKGFVEIRKREEFSWIVALTKKGAKELYKDPSTKISWKPDFLKHFGLVKYSSYQEPSKIARSLDSLVKRNKGFWKSEKQGKFLLDTLESPVFQNQYAVAWAKRQGVPYTNTALIVSSMGGFGKVDPSKIRYLARVYLVDKGGVVLRGRVKVDHYTKDKPDTGLNWSHVEVEFRRPKGDVPPIMVGDPEIARKRQIEENQPLIKQIKSIPGWESKRILTDFMDVLERGYTLSPAQLGVVKRMAPDGFSLSDKEQWEENFERMVDGIVKKMLPAYRALYKDEPDLLNEVDAAERELKHRGYVAREHVIGHELINDLEELVKYPVSSVSIYTDASEQLHKQHQKALKAKKPSKKAMKIETFIQRVADKLEELSVGQLEKLLDH